MGQITQLGPAIGFIDGQAQQADIAELGPEFVRKHVVVVDLRGARCDLVAGELTRQFTQLVDILTEAEIH